jgi:hypothetical protein
VIFVIQIVYKDQGSPITLPPGARLWNARKLLSVILKIKKRSDRTSKDIDYPACDLKREVNASCINSPTVNPVECFL